MELVTASHVVNVLVAGTFGTLLFLRAGSRVVRVYGDDTAARQILACLYLAIAATSVVALVDGDRAEAIALVLFPLQIVYKLLTLVGVRDRRNPVPWANLAISVLHGASLVAITGA